MNALPTLPEFSLSTSSQLCRQRASLILVHYWGGEVNHAKHFKQVATQHIHTHMHTCTKTAERRERLSFFFFIRGFSSHCLLPETALCILIRGAVWIQLSYDMITIAFAFLSLTQQGLGTSHHVVSHCTDLPHRLVFSYMFIVAVEHFLTCILAYSRATLDSTVTDDWWGE